MEFDKNDVVKILWAATACKLIVFALIGFLMSGCDIEDRLNKIEQNQRDLDHSLTYLEKTLKEAVTKFLTKKAREKYAGVCSRYGKLIDERKFLHVSILERYPSSPVAHSFCRTLLDFDGTYDVPIDEVVRTLELLDKCSEKCEVKR